MVCMSTTTTTGDARLGVVSELMVRERQWSVVGL